MDNISRNCSGASLRELNPGIFLTKMPTIKILRHHMELPSLPLQLRGLLIRVLFLQNGFLNRGASEQLPSLLEDITCLIKYRNLAINSGVERAGVPPFLVSASYDSLLNYRRRF
jgi:hypothetical protein